MKIIREEDARSVGPVEVLRDRSYAKGSAAEIAKRLHDAGEPALIVVHEMSSRSNRSVKRYIPAQILPEPLAQPETGDTVGGEGDNHGLG